VIHIRCDKLFCADMQPGYSPTAARHADKYDAAVPVYTAYNDSHRNARKYHIDSQAPENTSHFAMRITLFSSLVCGLELVTRLSSRSDSSVDSFYRDLKTFLFSFY